MNEPRSWHIYIPVRPKAVQSSRNGRGHFHADPKVIKWKNAIRPYIVQACGGQAPSKLPIKVTALRYYYRLPKTAKKSVVKFVQEGGVIPYLAPSDITDNLNKGVIDVCKGLVFDDDAQIWIIDGVVTKQYALDDHMELEFEETPDIVLVNGKPASESQELVSHD
jgi:Holliday junction resolvase RusA-like endonuclease